MIKLPFGAAVLALIALSPASAQETGSRATRDFLEAAAQSDAFEILESRTALTGSSDPRVRAFAMQMIHDHEADSARLRDATSRAGLKLPSLQVGADQAPMLAALQGERGADFDRTYARQQALAHRAALTVQQQYAATGDQPELRQAAASAVPMISSHLAMAEQLKAAIGGE